MRARLDEAADAIRSGAPRRQRSAATCGIGGAHRGDAEDPGQHRIGQRSFRRALPAACGPVPARRSRRNGARRATDRAASRRRRCRAALPRAAGPSGAADARDRDRRRARRPAGSARRSPAPGRTAHAHARRRRARPCGDRELAPHHSARGLLRWRPSPGRKAARRRRDAAGGPAPPDGAPGSANARRSPAADRRCCAPGPRATMPFRSLSWMRTVPPPSGRRPSAARSSVVLPAPLGPTMPVTAPAVNFAARHRRATPRAAIGGRDVLEGQRGAHASLRRRRISQRKNGAPSIAVTTPSRSWPSGAISRTATSAAVTSTAPPSAEGRISRDGSIAVEAPQQMRHDETDETHRARRRRRSPRRQRHADHDAAPHARDIDAETARRFLAERQRIETARRRHQQNDADEHERRGEGEIGERAVLERSHHPQHHLRHGIRVGREGERECRQRNSKARDRDAGEHQRQHARARARQKIKQSCRCQRAEDRERRKQRGRHRRESEIERDHRAQSGAGRHACHIGRRQRIAEQSLQAPHRSHPAPRRRRAPAPRAAIGSPAQSCPRSPARRTGLAGSHAPEDATARRRMTTSRTRA